MVMFTCFAFFSQLINEHLNFINLTMLNQKNMEDSDKGVTTIE